MTTALICNIFTVSNNKRILTQLWYSLAHEPMPQITFCREIINLCYQYQNTTMAQVNFLFFVTETYVGQS
jgi:hypothetical protein